MSCAGSKKSSSTKEMKQIDLMESSIELELGSKATVSFDVHGSVGNSIDIVSEDESIVKIVSNEFVYDNPDKSKMPGGDAGKRTFVFEAVNVGKTALIFDQTETGEPQPEKRIAVKVVAK
jgi:predicted secreted protein